MNSVRNLLDSPSRRYYWYKFTFDDTDIENKFISMVEDKIIRLGNACGETELFEEVIDPFTDWGEDAMLKETSAVSDMVINHDVKSAILSMNSDRKSIKVVSAFIICTRGTYEILN